MSDVTIILDAIASGDAQAADQLLPLVYEELRKLAAYRMANELPGQTLQATSLVHEAYLRLTGKQEQKWNGRGHFFAASAEAMRRILIENARRKHALRHGGGLQRFDINAIEINQLRSYENIRKDNLRRGRYDDVAYIDGYTNGLLYLPLDDKGRKDMPFYFNFGMPEMRTLSEFKEALASKRHHKASLSLAKRIVAKGLGSKDVFHHTPFIDWKD